MRHASFRAAVVTALSLAAIGALVLLLLPKYWVFLITAVFIVGIALQSLGLVTGRTGMISLCQMSFAGVGAWVTGWLNVVNAPGGLVVWMLIGGLAAVPVGVAIGLPALRLRGINLAIVTLGFAAAFDTVLATITFPGQTTFTQVARPGLFDGDRGYFIFVLLVYGIIAVALEFLSRSRLGASWLAVRHSERAAAAHGISIPRAKLSAFAISAFISGISGGLLAGYLGTLVSDNFSMMQSLALFAVATMVGAHFTLGAIIGGMLITLFPELLRRLNLPQDVGNELDISDITLQKQLRIESFVQKKVENVSAWHEALVGANKAEDFHADDQEAAPDGLGYIITLKGHHYYNNPDLDYEKVGLNFVEDTLMHNLRQWTIDDGTGNAVPVGQLGISHPIVVTHSNEDVIDPSTIKRTAAGAGGMYGMDSPYGGGGSYETPAYGNDSGGAYSPPGIGYEGSPMGPMGPGGGGPAPRGLTPVDKIEVEGEQETKIVKRTNFVLQFAWIPVAQADRQDSPPGTEGAEGEAPAETTE